MRGRYREEVRCGKCSEQTNQTQSCGTVSDVSLKMVVGDTTRIVQIIRSNWSEWESDAASAVESSVGDKRCAEP